MVLTKQYVIVVVSLIWSDFGANKLRLNKVVCDNLKRLPVFFVHCQEEQRKHDDNHAQCCQTDIARRFEQKEKRHSDERRCPKANELPFCQVKEHLGFYPRQVTRDRDICCQTNTSSLLVCIEYALCKRSCLKQGKAEQYGVAHDTPNIRNNIICKCKGLYQYRINANTDDD